ncbi:hypothetical protein HYV91_00330 [Candidatus Wolfebacteria bacterium]|nr:hypothetical protein [Candidatus Wolfebacteria bacterium]
MKRFGVLVVVSLFLCLAVVPLFADAASIPTGVMVIHSDWVKNQIAWFEAQEYSKRRVAFQRPFAWGFGIYRGQKVEWFAYTNTDAFLQFNVSVPVEKRDMRKLRRVRDQYKRRWVASSSLVGEFGPATATWIGSSNDWVDRVCNKDLLRCDNKEAVDGYVSKMNKRLGGRLRLWVAEYLM